MARLLNLDSDYVAMRHGFPSPAHSYRLTPRAMARAPRAHVEPAASLGPLRMIFAAASRYPGKVALALVALVITAAATLAIPSGFKLIIDRGFAAGTDPAEIGRWFRY